jgi:hypothetical protein
VSEGRHTRNGPTCWWPSIPLRLRPRARRHHTLWAYCHVPAGSTRDMTEAVTAQLERFAPGFRDLVVESKAITAAGLAEYNRNYVGGDFSAGTMDMLNLVQRPVVSPVPWRTPLRGVYLCSSSTPPGPGVTGMPGYPCREICASGHIWPARPVTGFSLPRLEPLPPPARCSRQWQERWLAKTGGIMARWG